MPDNKKAAIKNIWNAISFPEAALLGKRVPKKQFRESGELIDSDKKVSGKRAKRVLGIYPEAINLSGSSLQRQ